MDDHRQQHARTALLRDRPEPKPVGAVLAKSPPRRRFQVLPGAARLMWRPTPYVTTLAGGARHLPAATVNHAAR